MNLHDITGRTPEAITQWLQNTIGRINQVWSIEHLADGAHAIPQWRSQVWGSDIGASNFTASGSQTWTVAEANVQTFDWWKHGNAMMVDVFFLTTTVGGAASTQLRFPIPGGFVAAKSMHALIYLVDAGTVTTGVLVATKDSPLLIVVRLDGANLTNGSTTVAGQLQFRTKT